MDVRQQSIEERDWNCGDAVAPRGHIRFDITRNLPVKETGTGIRANYPVHAIGHEPGCMYCIVTIYSTCVKE